MTRAVSLKVLILRKSATRPFAGKTPLPGKGCSTPIVVNDTIYLTAPKDGNDSLLAMDWDGKIKWTTSFGTEVKENTETDQAVMPHLSVMVTQFMSTSKAEHSQRGTGW